jgi:hypothetical protein
MFSDDVQFWRPINANTDFGWITNTDVWDRWELGSPRGQRGIHNLPLLLQQPEEEVRSEQCSSLAAFAYEVLTENSRGRGAKPVDVTIYGRCSEPLPSIYDVIPHLVSQLVFVATSDPNKSMRGAIYEAQSRIKNMIRQTWAAEGGALFDSRNVDVSGQCPVSSLYTTTELVDLLKWAVDLLGRRKLLIIIDNVDFVDCNTLSEFYKDVSAISYQDSKRRQQYETLKCEIRALFTHSKNITLPATLCRRELNAVSELNGQLNPTNLGLLTILIASRVYRETQV